MRREIRRRDAAHLQQSESANKQEWQVAGHVPEVRNPEDDSGVGEAVIVRILRNRVDQQYPADCGSGHDEDQQDLVRLRQDSPTTS